jgi:hypothetical protein
MARKSPRSKAASVMGRPGRLKNLRKIRALSPEQRSARMRAMANVRWHPETKPDVKAFTA